VKKTYEAAYRKPIWPKGASGITCAVGYDLGYVNPREFEEDWKWDMSAEDRKILLPALGLKSKAARDMLPSVQSVSIPFKVARKQFDEQTLPKYIALTEIALKNTDKISDGAMGALVSLTFNRGASYLVRADEDDKGRFEEMRQIRILMREMKFSKIPAQIRKMKRIWQGVADMEGLLTRREIEAQLFEKSL
jgi:GH24 family phage-related lysozyme (muramidase)